MSYPIAHRLLYEASKFNNIEVRELLNWTRIVNNMYSLQSIDDGLRNKAELNNQVNCYIDIVVI